jgi:nitrite reductase/ring-hydroxylating ferredoxin subunit
LNDWSDTRGSAARVGVVHASSNTTALLLYTASLMSRVRRRRMRAKVLSTLGLGALLTGGYLGGHLAYSRGVDVNHTAWEHGPKEWTPVLSEADLPTGAHRTVDADGVQVLLYRDGTQLRALAATCSHMGGPLGEGTFNDGTVTCPWHGSTFDFSDGHIIRGPASTPEPKYEAQIRNGMIEVRATQPA